MKNEAGTTKIIFNIDSGKAYIANTNVLIGNIRKNSDGSYTLNFISSAQTLDGLRNYLEGNLGSVDEKELKWYYELKDAVIQGKNVDIPGTGQAKSIS